MKKNVLIITLMMLAVLTKAQSYEITYERTVNLHKSLPKGKKMLKFLIPETIKNKIIYKHTGQTGQLTECPFEKDESNEGMQTEVSKSVFEFNHDKKIVREYEEFNGYTYFVENSFDKKDIEKLPETKVINGYQCKSFKTKTKKGEEFVFWYSKDVPVNASPMPPIVVDGAILAIDNDKIQYKLISIEKKNVSHDQIAKKDAIKITEEQLSDLRKEQLEQNGDNVNISL